MAPSKNANKNVPSNLNRVLAGICLSALTAAMLVFAFHPYNIWFLSFVALIPMLASQYRIFPRKWAGLAPAIGIGGWLLIFLITMFIETNELIPVIAIVILIIIIQILLTPGMRQFHKLTGFRWFVLNGVIDWVGFEMIRSFLPPITSHAFIAQTMYTQPWILQPISVFSVYGLGVVIILVNLSLARGVIELISKKWYPGMKLISARGTFRWMIIAGSVLSGWILLSLIIYSTSGRKKETIDVAAIQHNFPIAGPQDTDESQSLRVKALLNQANVASELGAELIVMPELGLGFDPQKAFSSEFRELAKKTRNYLMVGYGFNDPRGWRNETVMLTPKGDFLPPYGKNHPAFPSEARIITSGTYPVFNTDIGDIASMISNDINFTGTTRKLARKGAQVIAVPTLETSGLALEHVAQCVLRAVENNVAIVKADAAYSSAVIDPYGKIIALRNGSPRGEAFTLVSKVHPGSSFSLYSYAGDWVGWICLAGMLYFLYFGERTRRKHLVIKINLE